MPRRDEDSDDRPLRRSPRARRDEEDDDDRPRRRRFEDDDEDDDEDEENSSGKFLVIALIVIGVLLVGVGVVIAVVMSRAEPTKPPEQAANPVVDRGVNLPDRTAKGGRPQAELIADIVLTNLRRNEEDKDVLDFDYKSPTHRGDEFMTIVTLPGRSPVAMDIRGFLHEEGMLAIKPVANVKFFPSGTQVYLCKKSNYRGGTPPQPLSNVLTLE